MNSLTKNKQNRQAIEQMVKKFFPMQTMDGYVELTEGYFNVAYEIFLNNRENVILKIAPLKETRVMTYEKNIMFSEVEAMKMARRNGGIPVPKVIGYDTSCTICGSDYFFMEKLEGKSLNLVKDTLSSDQLENISIEMGRINRKINEIV